MEKGHKIDIPDLGYVKYIDSMGSDETVVEAARMSTGKGFFGWKWEKDTYADVICEGCGKQTLQSSCPVDDEGRRLCTSCWRPEVSTLESWGNIVTPKLIGKKGQNRDLNLLEFLYMHKHMTPFEMGELAIEVEAPLFVFREWHRHRTQVYNEFSARYSQMPNKHYVPPLERFLPKASANKQESSAGAGTKHLGDEHLEHIRGSVKNEAENVYAHYEQMLGLGVPKEVARVNCPVSRYSKMRAKTDVRNWLGFLMLRMANNAQWEIRQYAYAVAEIVRNLWPRTFALFVEHDFLGVRFSRKEMRVIRYMAENVRGRVGQFNFTDKEWNRFLSKLQRDLEEEYAHIDVLQDI